MTAKYAIFGAMQLHRFYCNPITEPVCELTGSEAHHLAGVLKLSANQKVELIDGCGGLATAIVRTASSHKAVLQIEQLETLPQPSGPKIVIAPSVAKGHRFDWLITKCTELGVDRICPVLFERTVKQPKNPKTVERWRNLTISATKQCRRLFLPQIDKPQPLANTLETLKEDFPQAHFLLGSLSGDSPAITKQAFDDADVVAFVGPEGGVTEKEQALLQANGTQLVQLTDTVLRVETAALAFAAILAAKRKDLSPCRHG